MMISGEQLTSIRCDAPTFEIAWHPKRYLLAIACDEKDRYDNSKDSGVVKVWGFPGVDEREAHRSQNNGPKPLMSLPL